MYLVGDVIAVDKLALLYAVFKQKESALKYLSRHHPKNENRLSILEIADLKFPFFILAEIRAETPHFRILKNKQALLERISSIEAIGDFETFYFNMWRIENESFNQEFPTESILRGRDWHLHFTDHDLQDISVIGFDQYWNDILPE